MKFDSYAVVAEVLPYYGTLDKVYILMRKLNKNTHKIWSNSKKMISSKVTRLSLKYNKLFNLNLWNAICINWNTYMLFKLGVINIDTKEKYALLSSFLKAISRPDLLDVCFWFSLFPSWSTTIDLEIRDKF